MQVSRTVRYGFPETVFEGFENFVVGSTGEKFSCCMWWKGLSQTIGPAQTLYELCLSLVNPVPHFFFFPKLPWTPCGPFLT